MPLRFNKVERDEWRSRMAGKSHTCEACCAGNCKDCSGTCDCSDCHGTKDASVLDALESKTAAFPPDLQEGDLHPDYPPEDDYLESEGGQCPMCGGSSTMLGQLGNRVHYRCRNCGADHSHDFGEKPRDEFQDFEEELGNKLMPGRSEWSPEQVSPQEPRWGKVAIGEASMPPEAVPYQQKE